MRKIFFMSLLGYVIGIVTANLFCNEIIIIPFILVTLIVTCIFLCKKIPSAGVFLCLFVMIGLAVYFCGDERHLDNVTYINSYSEDAILRVDGNPLYDEDRVTFPASALVYDKRVAKVDVTVVNDGNLSVRYGDIIYIDNLNVSIPSEKLNKGETDYALYLKSHGISGSVYTTDDKVSFVGYNPNKVKKFIYDMSDYTKEVLYSAIPDNRGGFAIALITGDKKFLSEDVLLDIQMAGLSHVIAVSGMHMSVFVMLLGILFSRRKKRSYTAALLSNLLCVFMVIFTGGSYSVIRAALMVILANTGYFLGRGTYSVNSVLCAAGIMIVSNPFALFDASFILSFSATLSIVIFAERTEELIESRLHIRNAFLKSILAVTLSAQILVIPCLIIMKNTLNTYTLLSNILVSPVIPFLMGAVVLTLLFSKVKFVCVLTKFVAEILSEYVLKICGFVSGLPYSEIIVSDFVFMLLLIFGVVYCVLFFILVSGRKMRCFHLNLIFIPVVIVSIIVCAFFPQNTNIDFINVGQGDSALIRDRGVNILIDSGGSKNIDSGFGERVTSAYLRRKGVYNLDYVFISHFDSDHCQGVLSVIDRFRIKHLIVPDFPGDDIQLFESIISKAQHKGIDIVYAEYGDSFYINKDSFLYVVAPEKYSEGTANSNSLMLKYVSQGVSVLFAGDNDREEDVMRSDAEADILKIAHHGSSDSTSEIFLDRVNPSIAVISVGKNNIYSHPHNDVLDMLYERNIEVFRTDRDGSVSITLDDGKINVNTVK